MVEYLDTCSAFYRSRMKNKGMKKRRTVFRGTDGVHYLLYGVPRGGGAGGRAGGRGAEGLSL